MSTSEIIKGRFCLGTLSFMQLDKSEVADILDCFFLSGGTHLDCSLFYGGERKINDIVDIIKVNNYPAVVNVKIGHFSDMENYHNIAVLSKIIEGIKGKLKFNLCSVSLHEADWAIWWNKKYRPGYILTKNIPVTLKTNIVKLKEIVNCQGMKFGFSGNHAAGLEQAVNIIKPDIIMLAKQFDLLWRTAKDFLDNCSYTGMEIHLASPFHQGWLFRMNELEIMFPQHEVLIRKLRELTGDDTNMIVDLAVSFQLVSYAHTRVVIGVDSVKQLRLIFDACNKTPNHQKIREIRRSGIVMPPMSGPV